MYTQATCSVRNSATPIIQSDIDNQNLRMNRIVQPMLDGNSDLAALLASLTPPTPVNTCDDFTSSKSLGPAYPWPLPGWQGGTPESAATVAAARAAMAASISAANASTAAGVASPVVTPATTTPVAGSSPTPAGSPASTGPVFGRGGNRKVGRYLLHRGILDQLQRTVPNFACPSAKPSALPVPSLFAPAATPSPFKPLVSPVSGCPPQSQCMTGNICLDIRRGCVDSSQVSPQQMQACVQAGYQGVELFFPCVLATPNLPFLGMPTPNPPPYSSVRAQDVPPTGGNWNTGVSGLSGLGCGDGPGTLIGVLGVALGVAAGLFFVDWVMKQRLA